MSEKRFIQSADEQGYLRIKDTVTGKTSQKYDDTACTWLNELNEENKDAQILIQNISDQRNEFHQAVRENANHIGRLKKENRQLKLEIQQLKNVSTK